MGTCCAKPRAAVPPGSPAMGKGGSFHKLSQGGAEAAASPDGRDLLASYYGGDDEDMRTLRRGIVKFNASAKHGIEYLERHGILRHDAGEIAAFLHSPALPDGRTCNEAISKHRVGEYLGTAGKDETARAFHRQLLEEYTRRFDFRGRTLVSAVRLFLSSFRLPGEAQVIDRIMLGFAGSYVRDNPAAFSSPDAAYILAFGAIMLNTDLHRGQIKQKMGLEQFVGNMRGIDGGHDVSRSVLEGVYKDIAATPLASDVDYDVVTFFAPARQGWLRKRCTGAVARWKRRYFLLTDGCLYYFLSPADVSSAQPRCILPLDNVTAVAKGTDGIVIVPLPGASLKSAKRDDHGSMRRGAHEQAFEVRASNHNEREAWLSTLNMHVAKSPLARMSRKTVATPAGTAAGLASPAAAAGGTAAGSAALLSSPAASVRDGDGGAADKPLLLHAHSHTQSPTALNMASPALPGHGHSAAATGVASGGASASGGSSSSSSAGTSTAVSPSAGEAPSPSLAKSRHSSVAEAPTTASASSAAAQHIPILPPPSQSGTARQVSSASTASSLPRSPSARASSVTAPPLPGSPRIPAAAAVHAKPHAPPPASEHLLLSAAAAAAAAAATGLSSDADEAAWSQVAAITPQRTSAFAPPPAAAAARANAAAAAAAAASAVQAGTAAHAHLLQLAAAALAAASVPPADDGDGSSLLDTASEVSSVDESDDLEDEGIPYDTSGGVSVEVGGVEPSMSGTGSGAARFALTEFSSDRPSRGDVFGASLVAGHDVRYAFARTLRGDVSDSGDTSSGGAGLPGSATAAATTAKPTVAAALPPPPPAPRTRSIQQQPPRLPYHPGDRAPLYTEKGRIVSAAPAPGAAAAATATATTSASAASVSGTSSAAIRPREGSDELLMGAGGGAGSVAAVSSSSAASSGSSASRAAPMTPARTGASSTAAAIAQAVLGVRGPPSGAYKRLAGRSMLHEEGQEETLLGPPGAASGNSGHSGATAVSSTSPGSESEHDQLQLRRDTAEDEQDLRHGLHGGGGGMSGVVGGGGGGGGLQGLAADRAATAHVPLQEWGPTPLSSTVPDSGAISRASSGRGSQK